MDVNRISAPDLLRAELAQARRQVEGLRAEKEVYVRVCVRLALMCVSGDVTMFGQHVVVPRALLDSVPQEWTVALAPVEMKPSDAPQDAVSEEGILVIVRPVGVNGNGKAA